MNAESSMFEGTYNPRISNSRTAVPLTIGRYLLGIAALMFGVPQLVWHDFASNWHPIPPDFPWRHVLVIVSGALFVAGGVAVAIRRTARWGLVVISACLVFPAMFWLSRIIHFPGIFGTWSGFAEELAPILAAVLGYWSLSGDGSPRRASIPLVARTLFALCAVAFGIIHLDALSQTAALVPTWLPFGGTFWAIATAMVFISCGTFILIGFHWRRSAELLAGMLTSFAVLVWLPRLIAHPGRQNPWAGTAITLAVAGAALLVAGSGRLDRSAAPSGRHAHRHRTAYTIV